MTSCGMCTQFELTCSSVVGSVASDSWPLAFGTGRSSAKETLVFLRRPSV